MIGKPFAGTVTEAETHARAQERTALVRVLQQIYSPSTRWLCDKLQSGALGALREAYSVICWPRGLNYYKRNPWAGQLRANDRWILDGPATNATAHHINNLTYAAQAVEGDAFAIASVRGELYRSKAIPSYDTSCIEIITGGHTTVPLCHPRPASSPPSAVDLSLRNGSRSGKPPADTVRSLQGRLGKVLCNPDPATPSGHGSADLAVVKGEDKPAVRPARAPRSSWPLTWPRVEPGIIPCRPGHTYTPPWAVPSAIQG